MMHTIHSDIDIGITSFESMLELVVDAMQRLGGGGSSRY
jgi:hypothetical protein